MVQADSVSIEENMVITGSVWQCRQVQLISKDLKCIR